MHGPDKGNYPNEFEFIKIDKPNLIAWKRHSKPLFKILQHLKKYPATKPRLFSK